LVASSLRVHLLTLLLAPVAVLLAIGAVAAYFLSLEPASDAYDQALVDVGLALGERVRVSGGSYSLDLPGAGGVAPPPRPPAPAIGGFGYTPMPW